MIPTTDVTPESSPAPDVTSESSPAPAAVEHYEIPQGREAYQKWRQTGETAPSKKEKSAPSKETSAEVEQTEEKTTPASEAGKKVQEQPKRTEANSRIRELLAERKDLQERLAKLETGKSDVKPESSPAPKEQPKAAERPKRPVFGEKSDETWDQYQAREDSYFEDLADFKAQQKLEQHIRTQAEQASARELRAQVDKAAERYGAEAQSVIGQAVDVLSSDQIPAAVKAIINDSPVLADLLYVAGKDPVALDEFVALAKSNPSAALRKVLTMEQLVQQELAKGSTAGESPEAPARGEGGKFVSSKAPEKPVTKAPPVGTEVSGRSMAPPSDVDEAGLKAGVLSRSYRDEANRRDLERRRGR